MPSAENDVRLTDAEREALDVMGMFPTSAGFANPREWERENEARLVRVVENIIAVRLAEALAVVKRACDGECKSPGKHTGCHAHEPYRVLAARVFPPTKTGADQ